MQLVKKSYCAELNFKVALNLSHLILKIHKKRVFFCYKLSEGLRGRRVMKSPIVEVLLFLVHESLELLPKVRDRKLGEREDWICNSVLHKLS